MLLSALLMTMLATGAESVLPVRGILDQKAPSWGVNEWFQLPPGRDSLDVDDFEGKVVYLYCFQAWCPGCHSHGFPTLQKMIKAYGDDPDVAIVAVQTTFEGYSSNGSEQAKQVAGKYRLDIPVGQSGSRKERSKLMAKYRTGGTPWTIIIDKKGFVRYNDFHVDPQYAIKLIHDLKQQQFKKDAN